MTQIFAETTQSGSQKSYWTASGPDTKTRWPGTCRSYFSLLFLTCSNMMWYIRHYLLLFCSVNVLGYCVLHFTSSGPFYLWREAASYCAIWNHLKLVSFLTLNSVPSIFTSMFVSLVLTALYHTLYLFIIHFVFLRTAWSNLFLQCYWQAKNSDWKLFIDLYFVLGNWIRCRHMRRMYRRLQVWRCGIHTNLQVCIALYWYKISSDLFYRDGLF